MSKPDDSVSTHTLGRHTMVDVGMLAQRAADNALEAVQEVRKLREDWREIRRPFMRPWYERGAGAALVVVVLVFVILYATRTSSAHAQDPSPSVQAGR